MVGASRVEVRLVQNCTCILIDKIQTLAQKITISKNGNALIGQVCLVSGYINNSIASRVFLLLNKKQVRMIL